MLEPSVPIAERRATLEHYYASLPAYATFTYWSTLEAADTPLEILARCFRTAHLYEDYSSRDRLFTIFLSGIFREFGLVHYPEKPFFLVIQSRF